MEVIDVVGDKRSATYSLKNNHWKLARTHLLFEQRISAVALAGFLYRDYMIYSDTSRASAGDLVAAFQDDFGDRTAAVTNREEFDYLYVDDAASWPAEQLYEEYS